MASSSMMMMKYLLLPSSLILCILCPAAISQQSFRPKALVIPVSKDAATLQYVTQFQQRTPPVPIKVVVDLGGKDMWVNCEQNFVSSTYRNATPCGSAICNLARSFGCGGNICGLGIDNPITRRGTYGALGTDVVSLNSTNGSNPGRSVTVARFIHACTAVASAFVTEGLANGAAGIAGFGTFRASLPSQFSSAFSFNRKFAMCLSSAPGTNGIIIFGDGPYNLLPNIHFTSKSFPFTPLLKNPVSTSLSYPIGEPSAEYFIGVTSIKINDKVVPLNSTLLSIDNEGKGGTKFSTVNPYTVLESSIFKAVTEAFVKEAAAMNITRVASVEPFGACFSSKNVSPTRLGYAVPTVHLVLQNKDVQWTMFGANSMVQVSDEVLCLGFVDRASSPLTFYLASSIIIGGHQLEENLLQFDIATSRLGFSSLLYGYRTNCGNFNSTSST